jgi:hypothetical protein
MYQRAGAYDKAASVLEQGAESESRFCGSGYAAGHAVPANGGDAKIRTRSQPVGAPGPGFSRAFHDAHYSEDDEICAEAKRGGSSSFDSCDATADTAAGIRSAKEAAVDGAGFSPFAPYLLTHKLIYS